MSLEFNKPGILTTIQDLGRTGFRAAGINPNGVMDVTAARLVNLVLGNSESTAVLEMHFPAPVIEFYADTTIAIGGADFDAGVDGTPLDNWRTAFVKKGSVLKFAGKRSGNRAYLAVEGGFRIDEWLGSSSTNLTAMIGGVSGRKMIAGDRIDCSSAAQAPPKLMIGQSLIPRYSRFPTIRVVAGCEFELLTAPGEKAFLNEGFTLTNDCNRMGFRLKGKPLHLLDEIQLVSSAVAFGTIQLLPDGQMIVLMADHQTSGGYPRIGHVISLDLPVLAQCGPGDGVSFEMVTIEEAERLALIFEKELNFFRVGCRLRNQNANG